MTNCDGHESNIGFPTQEIPLMGRSEIGKLSENLEKMRRSFLSLVEDLKFSHRQIQEANLQLEEKVEARTREISMTNEKLQQEIEVRNRTEVALKVARDQAEEANRIKSQFIANMSHELRTPLTSIIGFSDLLIEEMADPSHLEWRQELQIIQESGKHLLAIINDILDLSKIEAGRMDLQISEFTLQRVVNEVAAICRGAFQEKKNEIQLFLPPEPLVMISDERKIRQNLLNLLSNANKFSDSNRIVLKVDSFRRNGVPWIKIDVQDFGIGMSQEQQNQLFQPFYQVDSSASRKHGGTGLGLAITKRFCELMGGEIACQSAAKQGTTMSIFIPQRTQG